MSLCGVFRVFLWVFVGCVWGVHKVSLWCLQVLQGIEIVFDVPLWPLILWGVSRMSIGCLLMSLHSM